MEEDRSWRRTGERGVIFKGHLDGHTSKTCYDMSVPLNDDGDDIQFILFNLGTKMLTFNYHQLPLHSIDMIAFPVAAQCT